MPSTVVLVDLENNMPSAVWLRSIVQHYAVIYLFNCQGKFEYSLEDLTELSTWISSGQVMVLETAEVQQKEFEYAVVVGQLLALLDADTQVELISAMPTRHILLDMMRSSDIDCQLIHIQTEPTAFNSKYKIPSLQSIQEKPELGLIKKYCDAVGKMKGKPNSIEKLKNSLSNILQVDTAQAQQLIGLLINLKLVKADDPHIHFRKKLLKGWIALDLEANSATSSALQRQSIAAESALQSSAQQGAHAVDNLQSAQHELFKNFAKIDPVQVIVARKLRELKDNKPQDIYALRDLLEQLFPKSDVRLLLKELIEKGYIYWNGSEVLYSHEMFLN